MLMMITVPDMEQGAKIGQKLSDALNIPYFGLQIFNQNLEKGVKGIIINSLYHKPSSQVKDMVDISVLLYQGEDFRIEHEELDLSRYDAVINLDCLGGTGTVELMKQFYINKKMQLRSIHKSA